MLLEYSLDTVDEKIGKSALELRRRFAERSLKEKNVSSETLLYCKESNKEQRLEHNKIDAFVKRAELNDHVSLLRSEHHLMVSQQVPFVIVVKLSTY